MKTTINCKGKLIDLSKPQVMGIVNITNDSFYAKSRCQNEGLIEAKVAKHLKEGAAIIDIGAYSTRPGCAVIPPEFEKEDIEMAMNVINNNFPDAIVSVDTFRAEVARFAVEELGVDIINDISGGTIDPDMLQTAADLHVPYIMMHMKGTPQNMMDYCQYDDMMDEITQFFATQIEKLKLLGACDIIIDPGFGFSKNLDQNYELMRNLDKLQIFGLPILVGVSRKSMIYKLMNTTPDDSLNGTTTLNTIALSKGAKILRAHDTKPAMEAIKICEKLGYW